MTVRAGIDVLSTDRAALVRGRRVGLIAHPASVGGDLTHAAELLRHRAGANVVRLFAPEHGTGGGEQDMAAVHERRDPLTGLPVVSLYGDTADSLAPRREWLDDIDVLVADLQDVGSRYYTFYATIVRALPVAAAAGKPVIVCDRPNPLGGTSEGNLVEPGFHSFVGELSVPNRHGLTIGELCRHARATRRLDVALEVIPAEGWRRAQWFDETGLRWVLPSPNMPTLDTAIVYPGTCLLEGTNLSEGRGTTRPFELVGAPWLDGVRLARRLVEFALPGVAFRPARFLPAFQKSAGQECQGVQLHVLDRRVFRPVLTGLAVVAAAREQDPAAFRWRTETYEFVSDRLAFDLLAGGTGWREALEADLDPRDIAAQWPDSSAGRGFSDPEVRIYPD